jgi:hypothetical protein
MTPKKWMKKYCKKDYVICDGMTNEMSFFDLLLPFIFLGIGWLSWILIRIYIFGKKGELDD